MLETSWGGSSVVYDTEVWLDFQPHVFHLSFPPSPFGRESLEYCITSKVPGQQDHAWGKWSLLLHKCKHAYNAGTCIRIDLCKCNCDPTAQEVFRIMQMRHLIAKMSTYILWDLYVSGFLWQLGEDTCRWAQSTLKLHGKKTHRKAAKR